MNHPIMSTIQRNDICSLFKSLHISNENEEKEGDWNCLVQVDMSEAFDEHADEVIQQKRERVEKFKNENKEAKEVQYIQKLKHDISMLSKSIPWIDERDVEKTITKIQNLTFELDSLTQKPVKKEKMKAEEFESMCYFDLDSDNSVCCICTEKCDASNPLMKMKCCQKSESCQRCIKKALNESRMCPFCRAKIPS